METLSNVYAPYIGVNGNWYVDNEDTGVKAQGPSGPQGPAGHCGMQGEEGERGEKGEKGDRGPKGSAGHCGTQGLIGPKGETGDRGPQGIQGPIGGTGIQGPKGDKGDKGETGDKGEKGDTPALAADLETTVVGKALDATMGKSLNDKVTELNHNLNTKAGLKNNIFTDSQAVDKNVTIGNSSYITAQFISQANSTANPDTRPCFGFHNMGRNGGAIYLDLDNQLKFVTHEGAIHVISMTRIN